MKNKFWVYLVISIKTTSTIIKPQKKKKKILDDGMVYLVIFEFFVLVMEPSN